MKAKRFVVRLVLFKSDAYLHVQRKLTHFGTKAIHHGGLREHREEQQRKLQRGQLTAVNLVEAQRFVVKLVLLEMSYLPTCSTQASSFLDRNQLEV